MNLDTALDIYQLINLASQDLPVSNLFSQLRKKALISIINEQVFIKVAFDTRRIDQVNQLIPRRGLQNYHRSSDFITESMSDKIKSLSRVQTVLEGMKNKFGHQSEWQDSYSRILLGTIENGLRSNIKDDDFSEHQPSMGSLDYIEELLHVRYRIALADLSNMSDKEIENVLFSRDDGLSKHDINNVLKVTKSDVGNYDYNQLLKRIMADLNQNNMVSKADLTEGSNNILLDKLLSKVHGSKSHEEEKSVTITIKL